MNKLIISIIGIAVVLAVAALSRPANSHIQSFIKRNHYINEATDWAYETLWPRASGEVAKIKQPIEQEITKQKDNFFQNMWGEATAYLAQKFSQLSGTPVGTGSYPVK